MLAGRNNVCYAILATNKSMEIIVVKNYRGLGALGELKNVAAGYAQNFLIPKGIAIPATPANRAQWQAKAGQAAKVQRQAIQMAQQAAKQLCKVMVTITAPANDHGTLFAAVSVNAIVAALAVQGVTVQSGDLQLSAPIKHIGEYVVDYRLVSGNSGSFRITVMAQQ